MGTAVAPNYVNLFMDRLETKALENYPLKLLIWKRFIDDIFSDMNPWGRFTKRFCELPNPITPNN